MCASAVLVLPEKPGAEVVPPYWAVRLCGPAANDGEHVAVLLPVSDVVQSVVAPSLKVTVPLVGFASDSDVTVAVNVSESPYVLGLLPVVRASAVDVVRRVKKLFPVDELLDVARTTVCGRVP